MKYVGWKLSVSPISRDPGRAEMKELNAEVALLGAKFSGDAEGVPTPWLADNHYEVHLEKPENLAAMMNLLIGRGFKILYILPDGLECVSEDDWVAEIFQHIETAVSHNDLLQVDLSSEELVRLKEGGLVNLISRLSEDAASMLYLHDSYSRWDRAQGPVLQILHAGRCR